MRVGSFNSLSLVALFANASAELPIMARQWETTTLFPELSNLKFCTIKLEWMVVIPHYCMKFARPSSISVGVQVEDEIQKQQILTSPCMNYDLSCPTLLSWRANSSITRKAYFAVWFILVPQKIIIWFAGMAVAPARILILHRHVLCRCLPLL